jgi:hypothetical protein
MKEFFQDILKLESKFVYTDIFLIYLILQCRSTFLKQMKFMHGQGFKIEEKYRLIPIVYRQIIYMQTLFISFGNPQNEVRHAFKLTRNRKTMF